MTVSSIPRAQRLPLAVLCAAALMTIVDETVVSVALPTIQRELHFATADLSWVVDAYLISFGGLLLLAGRIGDLVGRRRVLLAGVSLFTAASALCGAAAVALGMVAALFDDPARRAAAIGVYSFVGAVGASTGLFLGGLITGLVAWRWIFFINVPIGLVTVLLGRRVLAPDEASLETRRLDVAGAVLLVAGLMLGIFAIVGLEQAPPPSARVAVPAVVSLAALGLFGLRQTRVARPLVPLQVLRSRVVATANAVHGLQVGAMFSFQFLVTLYFQRVLGYGPTEAGLAVLPVALGIGAMSLLVFPRLAARFQARSLLLAGLAAIAAGLALLSRAPVDGRYLADVAPSIVLFAVGAGLTLPAVTTIAMSAATPATAGLASGLINTSQQVGGALGLAALATLAATHADGPAGLTGGFRLAWAVAAGLVALAFVFAFVGLRVRQPAAASAACPSSPAVG
jgi:MFS family permease